MGSDLFYAANALRSALEGYDEARGRELFERFSDWLGVDVVAAAVVPLLLRVVGKRVSRGTLSPAQGDFIRGALMEFLLRGARGWTQGEGPRAVLASTPGVQHEVSLIGFGLALRRRGWRITYLGVDVPIAILHGSTQALRPRLVVLSVPRGLAPGLMSPELRNMAELAPLTLLGASPASADALGARVLGNDLIAEAQRASLAAAEQAPIS